jgi:predicted RNA polymerase sigma factor
MIAGATETAAWYQARGVLLKEVGRWEAARRDFERYLKMSPEAQDRDLIVQEIQWLARLN